MYKILLVENDVVYRDYLTKILQSAGYLVDGLSDKLDGIAFFSQNKYDIVISNLAIDAASEISFLTMVKQLKSDIKTILIMNVSTPEYVLCALRMNVDFYFSKCMPIEQLIKYLTKIVTLPLPRHGITTYMLDSQKEEILVDMSAYTVYKKNREIKLRPKEYRLLVFFLQNKGRGFTRQELLQELWGNHCDRDERLVDKCVKNLRDRLHISAIASLRGYGYKWDE